MPFPARFAIAVILAFPSPAFVQRVLPRIPVLGSRAAPGEVLGNVRADCASIPRIVANDNQRPAGRQSRGTLRLRLEARLGRWYPRADSGPSEPIEAFAEEGHEPSVPGPLVRVRTGASIEVILRNAIRGKTLVVYGLHSRPGAPGDTIQVATGATRTVHFTAGEPGTYFYWASTSGRDIDHRNGVDSQLSGAIVVDSADADAARRALRDRIFVIGAWHADRDTTGPKPWVQRDEMVINGKSWPLTERFAFAVGDTVRWRWVNPTVDAHTMHLHGFFYTIESSGTWARDTIYAAQDRRTAVTEMMLPGGTMTMRWVPSTAGNWLFHCHFALHVSQFLTLNGSARDRLEHLFDPVVVASDPGPESMGHDVHEMAGMVLGIRVARRHAEPRAAATPRAVPRQIRLLVQSTPRRYVQPAGPAAFDTIVGYGFVVDDGTGVIAPDSVPVLSPTLVLRRGQPVRITVVNHLRAATAIHWHGIELGSSYFDGVPGWSGTPDHLAPTIAPRDSFVAEFTPPRAGTFIYHSHSNEIWQISLGLYGAIVVVDSGHRYEPATDRIFVIGEGPQVNRGMVNGQFSPAAETLIVGTTYRFRIVQINPDWRVFASVMADSTVLQWRAIAKDGADLPVHQATARPARVLMGPGETADFEFTPRVPGALRLEVATMLSGWRLAVPLRVEAAKP